MLDSTLLGVLLALATALPLAWKWGLGVRRTAVVVAALAVLSGLLVRSALQVVAILPVLQAGIVWFLTLAAALALLAYRFYRDPERRPPGRDDAIVSPADGEVLYLRESRGGELPVATKQGRSYTLRELTRTPLQSEDAVVIGIGMSFLDVHVNRAPIAGRITLRRHFPGRFGSLRRPEMVFANERATTVIEGDDLQVAVVQIASRLVRRIDAFVRAGQHVTLGQRIGVIRLGSQVDLVLPAREDVVLTVQPGERVRAGESIIAVLDRLRLRSARDEALPGSIAAGMVQQRGS
jgi:phosphatidylserine decarboxylase